MNPTTSGLQIPTHALLTEDALCIMMLLTSCSAHPHQPPYPPMSPGSPGPSPSTGLNWNLYEALDDTYTEQSYEDQLREDITQATLDLEDGECSDAESSSASCTSIIFILCGHAHIKN